MWHNLCVVTFMVHFVVSYASNLRIERSDLWKPRGLHSRKLLFELGDQHLNGRGYSRFETSHVVSVNEVELVDALIGVSSELFPIPLPFGENGQVVMCNFRLESNGLVPEKMRKEYPSIFSFNGHAPFGQYEACDGASAKLDFNDDMGFHGMVFTRNHGQVYIDPYTVFSKDVYTVYTRKGASSSSGRSFSRSSHDDSNTTIEEEHHFSCGVKSNDTQVPPIRDRRLGVGTTVQARRMVIAITTSLEYVQLFGSRKAALGGVTTTINRVSGIYERDFGVEFTFVSDQAILLPESAADSPLRNSLSGSLPRIDQYIKERTNELYHVGHYFITKETGLAGVGTICSVGPANGASGSEDPMVDAFHVDYVSHELGHQFGASHSFIGTRCQNANLASAVEPGSGNTIMGYAGICFEDNLQRNTDDYFHHVNLRQVEALLDERPAGTGSAGCGILLGEPKSRPEVNIPSNTLVIPKGTPFELRVSNPNEEYSYVWEQVNPVTQTRTLAETSESTSARFRSYQPRSQDHRWFPSKELLLSEDEDEDLGDPDGDIVSTSEITAGKALEAEVMANTAGEFEMAITSRSYNPEKAISFDYAFVAVEVADVGPFEITYPTSRSHGLYNNTAIEWDVNGVDSIAPTVSIYVSMDNGQTFDTLLAKDIPNTGKFEFDDSNPICSSIVAETFSDGRIMIASGDDSDHRFFTVSRSRVTITCNNSNKLILFGAIGAAMAMLVLLVFVVYRRRRNTRKRGADHMLPEAHSMDIIENYYLEGSKQQVLKSERELITPAVPINVGKSVNAPKKAKVGYRYPEDVAMPKKAKYPGKQHGRQGRKPRGKPRGKPPHESPGYMTPDLNAVVLDGERISI